MEGTKNSALQQNMKYILLIIGIVAIALSYFMGFSKYNSDISDIKDEIDTLDSRYSDLKKKEAKRKDYEKDKEEAQKKYDEILAKFDAGLSTERIIMDSHNLTSTIGVSLNALTLSEEKSAYVFGTENKDGKVAKKNEAVTFEMLGTSRTYSVQTTGTYLNMKEFLTKVMTETAKRRVPNSIAFAFDSALNTVTCNVNLTEYAIISNDREESKTTLPGYNLGTDNVFFTSLIQNADAAQ